MVDQFGHDCNSAASFVLRESSGNQDTVGLTELKRLASSYCQEICYVLCEASIASEAESDLCPVAKG